MTTLFPISVTLMMKALADHFNTYKDFRISPAI